MEFINHYNMTFLYIVINLLYLFIPMLVISILFRYMNIVCPQIIEISIGIFCGTLIGILCAKIFGIPLCFPYLGLSRDIDNSVSVLLFLNLSSLVISMFYGIKYFLYKR